MIDDITANDTNTTTTITAQTANMDATSDKDQTALSVAKAPSFCRLCDVELSGSQTWRTHVKSDTHVYKLRVKVAEPGSATSPPTPPPAEDAIQSKTTAPPRARRRAEPESEVDEDEESEMEDEPSAPDFVPGQCLFCTQEKDTLDESMTHMAAAHGFHVPFLDCLAVELETVVWYLHFVIYGYRECICCGTRRTTTEAVQQHMIAKGHCRFDLSPDTEEFYQVPQAQTIITETSQRDRSMPVRLPSGKLISHRKHNEAQEPRPPRRPAPEKEAKPFALPKASQPKTPPSKPSAAPSTSTEVATRQGGSGGGEMVRSSEDILAAQLFKLQVAGDRAQHKEEERKRGRLERANNLILFKHFRMDAGDGRLSRKFNG